MTVFARRLLTVPLSLTLMLAVGCRGPRIEPDEYIVRTIGVLESMGALPGSPPDSDWRPRFEVDDLADGLGAGAAYTVWPSLGIQSIGWGGGESRIGISVNYAYPQPCDYGETEFELLVLAQRMPLFVREGVCLVRVRTSNDWEVVDSAEYVRELKRRPRSPALRRYVGQQTGE